MTLRDTASLSTRALSLLKAARALSIEPPTSSGYRAMAATAGMVRCSPVRAIGAPFLQSEEYSEQSNLTDEGLEGSLVRFDLAVGSYEVSQACRLLEKRKVLGRGDPQRNRNRHFMLESVHDGRGRCRSG